jgi:predicted phosphoribosyltransferase
VFRDRADAGRALAELLSAYRGRRDIVVLGLARGGVPVAREIAVALGAPLDTFIVRKLGVPGHEEYAMGAVAGGGHVVVNQDVVGPLEISRRTLDKVAERERRELLRRESDYRGGRPPADVTGRTVILVDDGMATGASMEVAAQALRAADPKSVIVAVPVAPESSCRRLDGIADRVVCATVPASFSAVGEWFQDFHQVDDDEVRELLLTD